MRILPYGERALLAEVVDLDAALALLRALERDRAVGVLDLVPAARTVLVVVEPRILPVAAARRWIEEVAAQPPVSAAASSVVHHTIAVVYDGADLQPLADELGWSTEELVASHSGRDWTVAFGGFAPGFAYLVPGGAWPEIPRLAAPRTNVPAGSVAVAGGFGGMYPRASPGGWRLLGRTDAPLWDARRTPPALLAPGDVVRFEDVT
ncbi:allophanate hydrolase subunit 1 [Microbacteriaceae bacterium VKM Ac-2854]|nr:allophanate hydrolase subunit 1 [Microbacteriaceae bacterium VKM Ac-2854]